MKFMTCNVVDSFTRISDCIILYGTMVLVVMVVVVVGRSNRTTNSSSSTSTGKSPFSP